MRILSVTTLTATHLQNQGVIRLFLVSLTNETCGFLCKCLSQKLWQTFAACLGLPHFVMNSQFSKSDSDSFLSTSLVYRSCNTPLIQMKARQPRKPASYRISKSFKISSKISTWSVDGGRHHVGSDSFLTCPILAVIYEISACCRPFGL